MGRVVQRRIVRRLDLEEFLSQIEPHPTPKPDFEQYTISVDAAATMLYSVAYLSGDIAGKSILDLGCGTGRLALGAAFLGAQLVVGVDIDKPSVKVAFRNAAKIGLKGKMQWVVGDIDAVRGDFDTVLQNPPFGVQKRKADRKFLEKALETGKVVYSLHKSLHDDRQFMASLKANGASVIPVPPSPFLRKFIEEHGGRIRNVQAMMMTIPHLFSFHVKRKHEFVVDLYAIEGRK